MIHRREGSKRLSIVFLVLALWALCTTSMHDDGVEWPSAVSHGLMGALLIMSVLVGFIYTVIWVANGFFGKE